MSPDWQKVSRATFRATMAGRLVDTHTVRICDPAITFYWDRTLPALEGDAVYDSAIGKIVHDYNPKTNVLLTKYYLNEALV